MAYIYWTFGYFADLMITADWDGKNQLMVMYYIMVNRSIWNFSYNSN